MLLIRNKNQKCPWWYGFNPKFTSPMKVGTLGCVTCHNNRGWFLNTLFVKCGFRAKRKEVVSKEQFDALKLHLSALQCQADIGNKRYNECANIREKYRLRGIKNTNLMTEIYYLRKKLKEYERNDDT